MKRRQRRSSQPETKVTTVRPPGMKRATTISWPARSWIWRSAQRIRCFDFSPEKKRRRSGCSK
jgi:hypothetical protein